MKIFKQIICGILVLTLVCFFSTIILADETEPSEAPEATAATPAPEATPKPATVTTQDKQLAQALSNAYNIVVAPEDIMNLRVNNELGYGGIALLYGLVNASGKTIDDILALRQQDMGWGEIAKSLGLKVSDIMKKSSSALKSAKMDKEDKNLRNEASKKPSKNDDKGKQDQNKGSNNQNTGNNSTNGNSGNNSKKDTNSHKK